MRIVTLSMAFKGLLACVSAKRVRRPRSIPAALHAARRRAKSSDPFRRRYVDVSGLRIAYLEAGSGPPIVLVHGNMLDSRDMVASAIAEPLARRHRVIIFDRPGFGRTKRPRGTEWTPLRQAALLHAALQKLGIEPPIVVGHSLGSFVSVALALAHPQNVRALALLSGYYYPRMSAVAPFLALATSPVVGDLMRVTLMPTLGRLLRRATAKRLFFPAPVAQSFLAYSRARARSPSHLRASLEDATYLDPATRLLEGRYRELTLPIELVAGVGDTIVDSHAQSERFARAVPNARYNGVAGTGHMLHYSVPERVLAAIAEVERRSCFSPYKEAPDAGCGPELGM